MDWVLWPALHATGRMDSITGGTDFDKNGLSFAGIGMWPAAKLPGGIMEPIAKGMAQGKVGGLGTHTAARAG